MAEKKQGESARGVSVNERRRAREDAMKLLFEAMVQKPDDADAFFREEAGHLELKNDIAYVKTVYDGVLNHLNEIDSLIEGSSKGWKIGRIPRTGIAAMRICVYEMKYYFEDSGESISYNISINEAVELVKKYGEPKDRSFANGVLNSIAEKCGLK